MGNLALQLSDYYHLTGNLAYLEESIALQREGLDFFPPGHPTRSLNLNNLALGLGKRYDKKGNARDLMDAIALQQEGLALRPRGDPFRDSMLNNLAYLLSRRWDLTKDVKDLLEAINLQRESLELCPRGNPNRTLILIHLASYLTLQIPSIGSDFLRLKPWQSITVLVQARMIMNTMEEVLELLKEASQHTMSPTRSRMHAATLWRTSCRDSGLPSELEAIKAILNLMDLAVAESTTLEGLPSMLSDTVESDEAQGVASDAAALSLNSGDLVTAVSLLEQGRSIIYAQLGRYRPAVDDVYRISPDLSGRLVDLSVQLDALVVRRERIDSKNNARARPFDDDISRHFNARTAWNTAIDEIRQLPGLESFLLPPPFERLREAASEGPVIIVNINERRSDAIIVCSEGDPVLVRLPEASPEAVQDIIDGFGERPAECTNRKAIGLLKEIWTIIVGPIVTQLLHTQNFHADKPRIWWCPTGIASKLPLHAAGPYVRGEKNLGHLFVSSYTPTLGTLIRARQARGDKLTAKDSARSILIVGQPDTPEENPLPQVVDEVLAIKKQAPHASILLSSDGTKEAVLTGICQIAWLHLACHGHYDTKQPFHSSFSMHDERITLLELIGRDLPHAELAFLSACHSARASETLPDEALHPAAGMMFAGFKSVIGTMWAFDDGVGSALAGRFYELMVEGKKEYTDAAVVLADAMDNIVAKDKDAVPFMQRINIVHYGVGFSSSLSFGPAVDSDCLTRLSSMLPS